MQEDMDISDRAVIQRRSRGRVWTGRLLGLLRKLIWEYKT